ncbi:MAG: HD domain-containing protein [Thermoprotei archaeon]
MVIVSPGLIKEVISGDSWLEKIYRVITSDLEVRVLWDMANVMAVKRLKYNDHGPVHAMIAAASATELFKILTRRGVEPTLIRDGIVGRIEYAILVPMIGGFLHDIGNSIHRDLHEKLGAVLAKPIIERILERLVDEPAIRIKLRQEIMHSIHCTAYDVECLTIEAGCVKVGDGLDMAEGRARIPYKLGGISIHSISALSINKVEIVEGTDLPVRINVYMGEKAGIFQVDEILLPKIKSTPLKNYIEVYAIVGNSVLKTYRPE